VNPVFSLLLDPPDIIPDTYAASCASPFIRQLRRGLRLHILVLIKPNEVIRMLVKGKPRELPNEGRTDISCGACGEDIFIPGYPPRNFINEHKKTAAEAYEIVNSESYFDSEPKLNLATFVSTWMEPTAVQLMEENLDKNFIDKLIYSESVEMEKHCISMLAHLFHVEEYDDPVGTSTIGSTEAALLAGLNYKFVWKKWMQGNSSPADHPEIIFGSNVQICWMKFAKYFEVTPVIIPVGPDLKLNIEEVANHLSNNTICVVGILGDTFTGKFDDIKALNTVVDRYNKLHSWQIPIHVDAASGGFIAPFYPKYVDLPWDFRLKWVKSINVSGHKYGNVFAGVGWAIWRNVRDIDKELVFQIDYLGGTQDDFSLNFTKNASNIVAQYYNFVRLGKSGYAEIAEYLFNIEYQLIKKFHNLKINHVKIFKVIRDDFSLPMVVLSLTPEAKAMGLDLSNLAWDMKQYGWSIPAYPLPEPYEDEIIIRLVLKVGFNIGMAEKLYENMVQAVQAALETKTDRKISPSHGSRGIC
jgi:glutamate decarboxylase